MRVFKEKLKAVETVARILSGRNNLIGTDFVDIKATNVDNVFRHGYGGGGVQFTISHDALGKVASEEMSDALTKLMGTPEP